MKINSEWIINEIDKKVANHDKNIMRIRKVKEKYFQDPLVGFVKGDDEIFNIFKDAVGPNHMTPYDAIKFQADKIGVMPPDAGELTVVSYILPLNENTRIDNASSSDWLSERWAETRLYGEQFNQLISSEIVDYLLYNKILAVAPEQISMFKRDKNEKRGITSTWSHRHIAYAAGLGTFGIHDFLITEKGASHRCGSFIVNLKIPGNHPRSEDIHANCLHYQKINCLKCAARCPVNAININGHDKDKCSKRVVDSTTICREKYKLEIYGCGLCSTNVPCESGIPDGII